MLTIALAIFGKEGVKPDEASVDHLKKFFAYVHANRDKHFGNARSVRQLVGEVIKNQNLRLAGMKKEERTPELMEGVILDDVKEFEIKGSGQSRPAIGFQFGKK
jgi:hypothetical protein